ncbi:MAG: hypothetical protein JF603_13335 [Acidobacteria bacterium]|nr:hypothetical protein [Acidobacteriota bacterium]
MKTVVLTPSARRRRAVAVTVAGLALAAGSAWGSDDAFPFGPFHMFATSGRPTGAVRVATLVATDEHGAERELDPADVGLRRAELEGHYRQFRQQPALLAALASAYERRHHEHLQALRLEQTVRPVVNGRVQRRVEHQVVATWEQ